MFLNYFDVLILKIKFKYIYLNICINKKILLKKLISNNYLFCDKHPHYIKSMKWNLHLRFRAVELESILVAKFSSSLKQIFAWAQEN